MQHILEMAAKLTDFLESANESERALFCARVSFLGWRVKITKLDEMNRLRWNRNKRQLILGNKILHRFRLNATNQMAILDAFEKRHWPREIRLGNYPINLVGQKMHDVIYKLNQCQKYFQFSYSGKQREYQEEYVWLKRLKSPKH